MKHVPSSSTIASNGNSSSGEASTEYHAIQFIPFEQLSTGARAAPITHAKCGGGKAACTIYSTANLLALLTFPATKLDPSRPSDQRKSGAGSPLVSGELVQSCDGHNRESGDSRSAHEYLVAIVQRIAEHRIVFHAGCVSPLDARQRIALRSQDRAQEPD